MRKINNILTLLAFLLGLVLVANEPVRADPTIYLIDIQRIINESVDGKAARNNVEAEMKKVDSKLSKMRAEVEAQKSALEKQSSLLSPAALKESQSGLYKAQRSLQQAADQAREDLELKRGAEIEKVVAKINAEVADLAQSQSYSIIMEKDPRVVLYASDKLDLSTEIVRRMDQKKTSF